MSGEKSMKHVIVYGPGACGKTLNRDALAAAFGCEAIVDEVGLFAFKALAVDAKVKTLFLTCERPDDAASERRADIYSFAAAMQRVSPISGHWQSADNVPEIWGGTQLAVRMRGRRRDDVTFEEIDGFYLNALGLYFDDGCECFDNDADRLAHGHDDNGCPHTGFFFPDDPNHEEAVYLPFAAVSWCKR